MNNESNKAIELYRKYMSGEAKLVRRRYINHGIRTEKHYIDGQLVSEITSSYPTEIVLVSDYTPDDVVIQVEHWDGKYAIGAYPVSKESVYNEAHPHFPPYPKRGETFRCHYDFSSLEEAETCFEALKRGDISLKDIADKFYANCISLKNLAICIGY